MQKEIKGLRKKFFILSAAISFIIIFLMLLILNLLMHISYQKELKTAADVVAQAAYSNASEIDSEVIMLSDTEKNVNGDSIIMRDPTTIESITLNGKITCKDKNAEWYGAGGGVYFEFPDDAGNIKIINKEYKFNMGNTKITVDFLDNSNFLYESKPIETDISKVSKNCFYISKVWWAMSSTADSNNTSDVSLEIDSIDVQYRDNYSAASSVNFEPLNRNFTDIFSTEVPQTLNDFSCFFYITDKQKNIVEINSGNLEKTISSEYISSLHENANDTIIFENKEYKHFTLNSEKLNVNTYICDIQAEKNGHQLLLISLLSGGLIYILVVILIYFVSGKAVKPISESYQKQKEFISNVSHELKTPITVITATTELMKIKGSSERLIDCIDVQSEKMGRLINEMLVLSRLSKNQHQDDLKKLDLSHVVRNSALYFESRAFEEEKQVSLEIEENIFINGISDRIDDLVGILLDNAIKYSDEHSEVRLYLKRERENACLICENPCKDFDKNDLPHLFERFYRADKSHSGEKEGFGIGLSIAKEIVMLHKGSISTSYNDNIFGIKVLFKTI